MVRRRICIIGAGVSGLTCIKACLEEEMDPVCFEPSGDIGGLWRFTERPDGKACVMKTTTVNTSKEMMAFSDFPPDKETPNFMHHTKVMQYIRKYADQFKLMEYINFSTTVVKVSMFPDKKNFDGRWSVSTKCGESVEEQLFHGVMVCTGHHCNPYKPNFEGLRDFPGHVTHTHDCRDILGSDSRYRNRRCLVVGMGNSGVDLAVELSHIAKSVLLSTRSGAWVFSKVAQGGLPSDLQLSRLKWDIGNFLGFWLLNKLFSQMLNSRFDHALYGLKPAGGPLQQHGTVSDALPEKIISGGIIMKNNVSKFRKSNNPEEKCGSVEFDDGSVVHEVHEVILATGYTFAFPFLDPTMGFEVEKNQLPLYKFVFPPKLGPNSSTLAFIGYVQPHGSTLPISEMQARWAVRVFKGKSNLPSADEMEKDIYDVRTAMSRRYLPSQRHTIQLDVLPYMDYLAGQFGCLPPLKQLLRSDPRLAWAVYTQPTSAYQYRLTGPHAWKGARQAILQQWDRIYAPFQTRTITKKMALKSKILIICVAVFCVFIAYLLRGVLY